jgi:3-carboxy-cis,cis-muconate cycloisomerase
LTSAEHADRPDGPGGGSGPGSGPGPGPAPDPGPGPGPGPGQDPAAELGLLAPGRVDSAVEAATGDAAWLAALLDAEVALVRAAERLGRAPAGTAATVAAAASAVTDVRGLAVRARQGGNPVIPLAAELTAAVRARDPQAAPFVHRGATSQDILDTAAMLVCARALRPVLGDLAATARALGELARAHRATPMPGRTLTQHAVPTTFGLKAAGWRALVLDAHDRLTAARAALPAQLGGAAGTLAAFEAFGPEEAGRPDAAHGALSLATAFAAETGLTDPALPWHTLRTPVADLAGALAFTGGALGKLAADVLVLGRTEIAEVTEGSGGGSSAMPHKSNPVRAALIAAAARQLPQLAAVLYGSMAAEDERPAGAWHAEWQPLRDALRLAGGAARDAHELAAGLVVHPGRMRANLARTGGLPASERLAAALTPLLGRDAARHLLTTAARRTAAEGIPLADVLAADPALRGALPEARLRELADPAGYLGAAPELTDRALDHRPDPPQETP